MSVYESLGVRTVINGVGPATRLGGLPIADEVWKAMQEATRTNVLMSDLQIAAGRRIAEVLRVPGAYVTSGASAALSLATASAMTRDTPAFIDQLPDINGMPCEVVIQKAHRDPYDHAVTSVGARLIEVGYPASTHPDELSRVLGPDTAAVLFRPGLPGDLLSLQDTATIAHRLGIPVIVDGALFVPPVDRLRAFFDDGADLVAVSGGKGFRGPQASGLLCAAAAWLDAAALHHQDMDERSATWVPPAFDGQPVQERGQGSPPRHGVARGMKVGREQVIGLLAAVERYVGGASEDSETGIAELDELERGLADDRRLAVNRGRDMALDVPVLHVDVGAAGIDTDDLVSRLAAGDPAVVLGDEQAWRGVLTVNPMALGEGHGRTIMETLLRLIFSSDGG